MNDKKLYFDVQLHYDTVISTQNYSNITVMYCVFYISPINPYCLLAS